MDPSEDGLAIVGLSFFILFFCICLIVVFLMFIYIFIIICYRLLLYIYILSLFLGYMLIMHYEHIYIRDTHVYYLCR